MIWRFCDLYINGNLGKFAVKDFRIWMPKKSSRFFLKIKASIKN